MRRLAGFAILTLVALAGCGGGGTDKSTRDAKLTVQRYFTALAGGDARGVCSQMTEHSQEQLGEFADVLHLKLKSCAGTISALMQSPASARLRTLRDAQITAAEHHGAKVTVHVDGVDRPISLVQQRATWLISSSPLAEADNLPGG